MGVKYQRPRGTKDILPGEYEERFDFLERARQVLRAYGYRFMETPVFEKQELFVRSIGDITDIVEKEMFTFVKGDDAYALRPEGTASAARAFLENRMKAPAKMAYWGPFFRAERPQKGRMRQFTQLGIECFGVDSPLLDAEQIRLGLEILGAWGLERVSVLINSIGCPRDRVEFRRELRGYLEERRDELCPDCQRRLDKNPVRVLDCKVDGPKIKDAPSILDYLCDGCKAHYEGVKDQLSDWGIPFQEEPRLWRGLDYYTRTVFEFKAGGLGAKDSVGGGGRYDLLVEELGGPPTPASGWAVGVERALLAAGGQAADQREGGPEFFVVTIGPGARQRGLALVERLRDAGLWAELDYDNSKPSKQMKIAHRLGAGNAVILGEDELARGVVKLRNMDTGQERFVKPEELLPD